MTTVTARGALAPDQPIFSATLTPHNALSPLDFRLVMTLLCAGALVQAVPMVMMGAWPVGWFFGLDLLVIYVCFRISFARGRRAEQVEVSRMALLIRKFGWRGEMQELRFNPFWVRLKTVDDPDYGMQRVSVVQSRQEVELGSFLAPYERENFAKALSGALAEVKR